MTRPAWSSRCVALGAAEWAAPCPAQAELVGGLGGLWCVGWVAPTSPPYARPTRTGCSPLRFRVASSAVRPDPSGVDLTRSSSRRMPGSLLRPCGMDSPARRRGGCRDLHADEGRFVVEVPGRARDDGRAAWTRLRTCGMDSLIRRPRRMPGSRYGFVGVVRLLSVVLASDFCQCRQLRCGYGSRGGGKAGTGGGVG